MQMWHCLGTCYRFQTAFFGTCRGLGTATKLDDVPAGLRCPQDTSLCERSCPGIALAGPARRALEARARRERDAQRLGLEQHSMNSMDDVPGAHSART